MSKRLGGMSSLKTCNTYSMLVSREQGPNSLWEATSFFPFPCPSLKIKNIASCEGLKKNFKIND